EPGHLVLGELDLLTPEAGQREVGDLVLGVRKDARRRAAHGGGSSQVTCGTCGNHSTLTNAGASGRRHTRDLDRTAEASVVGLSARAGLSAHCGADGRPASPPAYPPGLVSPAHRSDLSRDNAA